jgi:hypothetical protein
MNNKGVMTEVNKCINKLKLKDKENPVHSDQTRNRV